ncbi:hypothetical protein ACVWWG_001898 [Bradyrhizobium sp. LB7.2]
MFFGIAFSHVLSANTGRCVSEIDGMDRLEKRTGGGHYLLPGFNTERLQAKQEPNRAAWNRNAILRADSESSLERLNRRRLEIR